MQIVIQYKIHEYKLDNNSICGGGGGFRQVWRCRRVEAVLWPPGLEYNCLESCRMTSFDIKLWLILAHCILITFQIKFFASLEEIKTNKF